MRVVSPPLVPLVAAPRTSLLPIQIEMNVGCALAAICTCVRPPRKNCVSEFACAPTPLVYTSLTNAPGTAVLLMNGGGTGCGFRSAQVVDVLGGSPSLVNRAPVKTFVYGGGHPGLFISGEKNGVCIARASSTAYDCDCVLSLMPPDWNPAVIELPIETYRLNSASTGVELNGRFSFSSLHAVTANSTPRTAAESRIVRFMSR